MYGQGGSPTTHDPSRGRRIFNPAHRPPTACGRLSASNRKQIAGVPTRGLRQRWLFRAGACYGKEMQKVGDTGDISVLFFFSAGANFWAILGHFWAILAILGNFWAKLGNFGSFLAYFG